MNLPDKIHIQNNPECMREIGVYYEEGSSQRFLFSMNYTNDFALGCAERIVELWNNRLIPKDNQGKE